MLRLFYGYLILLFFFFNDTATTEIYTLSLHDALPIFPPGRVQVAGIGARGEERVVDRVPEAGGGLGVPEHSDRPRSEEHTSELQSRQYLVCRLLLEKKKNDNNKTLLFTHETIDKHL